MSALDRLAVELGKRDERDDLVVHVRAYNPDGTVGALLLHHLQDDVLTRRPDRNHHDSVRAQLAEQRRRNVIDTAGNNNLVERCGLFPLVIAVGILGIDRLVLGIAAPDEVVVDAAGTFRQRLGA
jgi:hypothetical protein